MRVLYKKAYDVYEVSIFIYERNILIWIVNTKYLPYVTLVIFRVIYKINYTQSKSYVCTHICKSNISDYKQKKQARLINKSYLFFRKAHQWVLLSRLFA